MDVEKRPDVLAWLEKEARTNTVFRAWLLEEIKNAQQCQACNRDVIPEINKVDNR